MHPKRIARRLLPWAVVLTLGLIALTPGGAQPPDPKTPPPPPPVLLDKTGALVVPLGGSVTFDPKIVDPISEVLVRNREILRFTVGSDLKTVILTGVAPGVTQLTIFRGKDKPALEYEVVVKPDLTLLRRIIKETVPTSNVTVEPGIGSVVILGGYVTNPQDADIVARLANSAVGGNANNVINAVQIGGVQQVQIDVVIASVDRTALRQRGFDFSLPNGRGDTSFQSLVSGLLGGQVGGAPTFSGNANLQLAVTPLKFFAALQALRTEGVAKFLAEPRVVTQTGRTAFFRAGGQQAILSGTSGITGPGVQLVPFGTELEVVPNVYGNNMIWLDINPRVTAVSQGLGISVGGANSPGFTEQQVRSTVMLESGQTFAIGGLIQNSVQATANKVPVLGDLPFSGTLFSSVSYQTRESELIILVTPRLVHPMDPCQTPKRLPGQETRTPDDYELFLENILEAPRGQRKVWNGKCYNAPYKCDPTTGKYPCAGNVCTGPNGTCLPANPGYGPTHLIGNGPAAPGAPSTPAALPALPPLPPTTGTGVGVSPMVPEAPAPLPPVSGTPIGGTDPVILPPPPPPAPVAGSPPQ